MAPDHFLSIRRDPLMNRWFVGLILVGTFVASATTLAATAQPVPSASPMASASPMSTMHP
jgi:hypothetical protein